MKRIILVVLVAVLAYGANAQDYKFAVGANLGPSMGVTMKYNFNRVSAVEMLLTYSLPDEGPNFVALYEYHVPLQDRFRMYMGGGLNMGALDVHKGKKHSHDAEFAFGIDPIIGLEYNVASVPLSLAFDYKPVINFTTYNQWQEVSFKIRFAF